MSKRPPRTLRGERHRKKLELVTERDGGVCWICNEPVNAETGPSDPERSSLDHVHERAAGGSNGIDNLRLAHAVCNEMRDRNRRAM